MALTNNINYYLKHYSFPGVGIRSRVCVQCVHIMVCTLCNNGLLWVEYYNNTSIKPVLYAFDCVFACFN